MTRTVPTGRDHEIREIPPAHCGTVHHESPGPDQPRRRSYRCRTCGAITWD